MLDVRGIPLEGQVKRGGSVHVTCLCVRVAPQYVSKPACGTQLLPRPTAPFMCSHGLRFWCVNTPTSAACTAGC